MAPMMTAAQFCLRFARISSCRSALAVGASATSGLGNQCSSQGVWVVQLLAERWDDPLAVLRTLAWPSRGDSGDQVAMEIAAVHTGRGCCSSKATRPSLVGSCQVAASQLLLVSA